MGKMDLWTQRTPEPHGRTCFIRMEARSGARQGPARAESCRGRPPLTRKAAGSALALTENYRAGDKWVLVLLKVTDVKAHHWQLTLSAPDKPADKMLGASAATWQNPLAPASRGSSAFLLP